MRSSQSHGAARRAVAVAVTVTTAVAVALSLGVATAARADIGVIPTVVDGFDEKVGASRKNDLDDNVRLTLQSSLVSLALRCEPGTYDAPPDARCVKDAVNESTRDIDEVAQVLLQSAGPHKSAMKLRIFGRDGVPIQEATEEIVDARAAVVTTAMLRKAFDPSRFSGTAIISGAPADAELLVDGLQVDGPRVTLRVGRHVLEVVHPDGAVETLPFEVGLDKEVPVVVPSAPRAASVAPGPPLYVSASAAGVGAAATIVAVILLVVSTENRDEWHRRALGRTFPRNNDDPICRDENGCTLPRGDPADPRDDEPIGWLEGYGPRGGDQELGQGARFMMVALSRDSDLRWDAWAAASLGLAIGGGAALVGGGIATYALWPSDAPAE